MSDEETKIYLDLLPEYQHLLSENRLSVKEILRQQNIHVEMSYGISPEEPEVDSRSKDPVMVILASGATALMVGIAISKVLHTLQRKPQLVEYYELTELRDANGDIILNEKGKAQLIRQKKVELFEPRKEDSSQTLEIGMNQAKGLVIKFGSIEKQMSLQDKIK